MSPTPKKNQVISDRDYAEAIVDTIQQPLVILDSKFFVISANKSFYKVFHTSKKNTEGKLFYKISGGQWDLPNLHKLLDDVLTKKSWFLNLEIEKEYPTIGKRVMLLSGRKILQKRQYEPKILIVIEDITERIQIERQKDDFIGIASHELKTPVTSIQLYGEILRRHTKDVNDVEAAALVEKMDAQLNKLNELVASFVNVYNLRTGQLKLKKTRFLLNDLVTETIANFQYTINTHTIQQGKAEKVSVFADRRRISQVLVNLISNAIKYSPKARKVLVSLRKDGRKALVSIRDFGMGIPLEEQSKIFDRFFRAKGKRDGKIPGLGLGLYISQEIITQHRGKLWTKSIEGKGSTFHFTLPIK